MLFLGMIIFSTTFYLPQQTPKNIPEEISVDITFYTLLLLIWQRLLQQILLLAKLQKNIVLSPVKNAEFSVSIGQGSKSTSTP